MSLGRPKQGARIELLLRPREASEGDATGSEGDATQSPDVAYRMTLTTAEAQWVGTAQVGRGDGAVRLETPGEPPPRWLADFVRQLLRTSWNARRGEDASPWPERITRWRDERVPLASQADASRFALAPTPRVYL